MKPLIGIICDKSQKKDKKRQTLYTQYELNSSYAQSIYEVGGLPLFIGYELGTKELLERIDGLVFTGGDFDIHPRYFNASPHPKLGTINEERTTWEFELMAQAIAQKMPFLGICAGMQLLNIVQKGTLYQDIPSQKHDTILNHEQPFDKTKPAHHVLLQQHTVLSSIYNHKERIDVNSTHHQGIKVCGQGLVVNATSEDGLIEGIELPKHTHPFGLGVQWHPELLSDGGLIYKSLIEHIEHI